MGWRSFLSQVLRLAPLFNSRFTIWMGRSGEEGKATIPPHLCRQRCLRHLRSPDSGRGTRTEPPVPKPALPTSRWPLCTAWCSAVRPVRSATLTVLSRGMMASTHLVARLAAATCRGVCQYLSRALTSAECFRRR